MSQTLLVKCSAEIQLAIVEHTPFGQAEFKTVPPSARPLNLGYRKTPFEKQMLTLYAIKPEILGSTRKSLTLGSGEQFS